MSEGNPLFEPLMAELFDRMMNEPRANGYTMARAIVKEMAQDYAEISRNMTYGTTLASDTNEDRIVKEFIEQYVMTVPGEVHRSVFYCYVVLGETVEEISERYDLEEDETVEMIDECQTHARNLLEEKGLSDEQNG